MSKKICFGRYIEYDYTQDHYIDVKRSYDHECSSYVGMVKPNGRSPQTLKLWFDDNDVEESCQRGIGTVIHEFLHALGETIFYSQIFLRGQYKL